ncbi:MAG: OmpH family outer membrane protein [Bacteroidales bacterium]|nr:OmpH family outer membrane protein [Bacteroidales bacterium]
MKKLVRFLLVVVLAAGIQTTVKAQAQKFGHVDSSEILQLLPERATAEKAFQNYMVELDKELQNMAGEYQSKLADYQANQATMSALVKQSKEKELTDLGQRIQEYQSNAEVEAQKKQVELMEPLIKKVQDAVNAVGKEQGFTYIFDKSIGAVVYLGDSAIDITNDVKKKLGL